MIHRLVQSAHFECAMAAPQKSRSIHFAVHYLAQRPVAAREQRAAAPERGFADAIPLNPTDLSTGLQADGTMPVDDSPQAHWLGYVVPKRHAKRAVTRSLLKRHIRAAFERHAAALPHGIWLVRLRSPFARTDFASARSEALAQQARLELDRLLEQAAAR